VLIVENKIPFDTLTLTLNKDDYLNSNFTNTDARLRGRIMFLLSCPSSLITVNQVIGLRKTGSVNIFV